jgi:hypothetical protein
MEKKIDGIRYPDPEEPLDPFFLAGAVLFAHCLDAGVPAGLQLPEDAP